MADVRINGKRIPPLQVINDISQLIQKLDILANESNSVLTSLLLNNSAIDVDNFEYHKLKLEKEDTLDARFDTAEQLSFESLQVALDMADLLILDLKMAAVKIWDNNSDYIVVLDTLIEDCRLFLNLAARPVALLHKNLDDLDVEPRNCLQELDRIAGDVENATLLAVRGYPKESCFVLGDRVKSAIERWVGLSALFARSLNINSVPLAVPAAPLLKQTSR